MGAVFAPLGGGATSESMFCAVKTVGSERQSFGQTDAGISYSLGRLLLAFFSFDFDGSSFLFTLHTFEGKIH